MWTKCLEDTFPNNICDSYSVKKYNFPNNVNIELSYMFVPSKINYYQLKLTECEKNAGEENNIIRMMDNSISILQSIQ